MKYWKLVSLLAAAPLPPAEAQVPLLVEVVDAETAAPVPGVTVRTVLGRLTETTDRLGRARFLGLSRPDTLLVTAVGYVPETLTVDRDVSSIRVALTPRAVSLPSVTVTADLAELISPSQRGEWIVGAQAIRSVPPAVEPDPLRALAGVPSVSFSSPLSGRPLIRGYDAAENVIRLDGFEILNPYHIGRAFSAFPVEAVAEVALTPSPAGADVGETLAGVVDLRGRSRGRHGRVTGGAGLSVTSATGWLGTDRPIQSFLAARAAFLEAATDLIGDGVPYAFQDVYVRTGLPLGTRGRWDLTLYGSHDDFAERAAGHGMEWSNVLVGNRWRALDGARGTLDVTASVNRFALDGVDLEVNDSRVSVTNRFTRLDGGVNGTIVHRGVVLRAGAGLASWDIAGAVDVLAGDAVSPVRSEERFGVAHTFAEAEVGVGRLRLRGGVRLDASETAVAVQPRARLSAAVTGGLTASASLGRAARLFQRVTDQQPEPAVTFFDHWLTAGDGGTPVPRVDHATLELDAAGGPWTVHGAVFATRGAGLAELRPVSDQTNGRPMFRFGDSRTAGLELRVAWGSQRPQPLSGALTYVVSSSERRWEDDRWRPWRLDRRHLARLQLDWRVSRRVRAFSLAEATSGQPVTPVREVVWVRPPPLGTDPARAPRSPNYLFDAEGSERSAGTLRFDLGLEATFGGPGDSRILLGLSAINLGFGPVAPEEPIPVSELLRQDGTFPPGGVPLVRRFTLPAIPSVTVRIEF